MKFIGKYAHTTILLFGLFFILIQIIAYTLESSRLVGWQMHGAFVSTMFLLTSNVGIGWDHFVNFFWVAIFILLIIATFPNKMTTKKTEELLPLAIGFLVGNYLMYIIGYPVNYRFYLVFLIEAISIIMLIVLYMVYTRSSFLMTYKQRLRMKIIFVLFALFMPVYRFIFWNLVRGESSLFAYSILGGVLILGIVTHVFMNKETVEVNSSPQSIYFGLLKSMGLAAIVYILFLAPINRLPDIFSFWTREDTYYSDLRVLYVESATIAFYSWIILRSVFDAFNMKKSRLTISLILPIIWISFSIASIYIFTNYWVFTVPMYALIAFGVGMLYHLIRSMIQEKRWEIQLKETIELNHYT